MNLPTFLVIGAAKAGTTALYLMLRQHPEVFMSAIKETNYFIADGKPLAYRGPGDDERINKTSVVDFESYLALFRCAEGYLAIGEVSPLYLYFPSAAPRIHEVLPDVKLVAILRNPVDRAYSAFLHLRRDGREPLREFEAALEAEPKRIADGWQPIWHYKSMGFYSAQLAPYFARFRRDQIRIFSHEEYREQPKRTLEQLFDFLDVDPSFQPSLLRRNVSGLPRSSVLQRFLTRPSRTKSAIKRFMPASLSSQLGDHLRAKNLKRPRLRRSLRERLVSEYEADIRNLEELLDRDLSTWREIEGD